MAAALVLGYVLTNGLVDAKVLSTDYQLLALIVGMAILSWLLGRAAPRLVTLRVAVEGEELDYPLERRSKLQP
jgi:hypothetical protein